MKRIGKRLRKEEWKIKEGNWRIYTKKQDARIGEKKNKGFEMWNVMRQSCPLSSLLFNLVGFNRFRRGVMKGAKQWDGNK